VQSGRCLPILEEVSDFVFREEEGARRGKGGAICKIVNERLRQSWATKWSEYTLRGLCYGGIEI
jgi:hypothetical protein